MKSNEIEVVVFDFDGTLFDTKLDYKNMKKDTFNFLTSKYNLPQNYLSTNYRINKMVTLTIEYLRNHGRNVNPNEVLEDIDEILKKYEIKAIDVGKPKDGLIDVLDFLKKRGMKIAILTNTNREVIEAILEKYKVDSFFDIVVTRNETKVLKPNPKGLLLISESLNVPTHKIVFIGDSIIDMQTAVNAKAHAWGFVGGVSSDNDLREAGAELVIRNLKEIKTIFDDC